MTDTAPAVASRVKPARVFRNKIIRRKGRRSLYAVVKTPSGRIITRSMGSKLEAAAKEFLALLVTECERRSPNGPPVSTNHFGTREHC